MLKNRNNDDDNDKLQCFIKRLISHKYKKNSPGKYTLLLYLVFIRWIFIMFDALEGEHYNFGRIYNIDMQSERNYI